MNCIFDYSRKNSFPLHVSTLEEAKTIILGRAWKCIFINWLVGSLGTGILVFLYYEKGFRGTTFLQESAEDVASYLESLTISLMDNPVGLKLNGPLSNALGAFFLYHIYLWRIYIISLQSLMTSLWVFVHFLGLFGASLLIAGLKDLLKFITFHCYVFYVYAARLYNINMLTVNSLWRLFRGKKYNPIRQCVDSGHFETDQIIVGMIVFMIAGFMLPTTAVYYFVFLTLPRRIFTGFLLPFFDPAGWRITTFGHDTWASPVIESCISAARSVSGVSSWSCAGTVQGSEKSFI
ncbi:phosphatidylinositol N-acetylglucosaminyltransferase subunit Q-like [Artemia franciscana]|uniref:phosphatidylinositol N-acetylglucosaminyltransferase subunit Q-like n=1 Tax=Artemia franciscana TaxID=6661 RepID=UPI0032DA1B1E